MALASSMTYFAPQYQRTRCALVPAGVQRLGKHCAAQPARRLALEVSHRRLKVAIRASLWQQELSTYRFARQPAAETEWFNVAVRDIVKHVDSTPFLQLVELGDTASRGAPKFTTIPVADSVVTVPELWSGIAEHMSSNQNHDVVILVQQVNASSHSPSAAAQNATPAAPPQPEAQQQQPSQEGVVDVLPVTDGTAQQAQQAASSSAAPGPSSSSRAASRQRSERIMQRVEAACSQLMQSGIADSLLMGKVGDCCETLGYHLPGDKSHQHHHGGAATSCSGKHGEQHSSEGSENAAAPVHLHNQQQQQHHHHGSIVPFRGSPSPRRRAVQVSAIPAPPTPAPCTRDVCYYGLVVQSALGTGVEGCYLLKTVKNTTPTGCSCTHFSLVRVCQGEHLEEQFVQSWLA